MSGKGGGGVGVGVGGGIGTGVNVSKGNNGISGIPPAARKIVQSLKEIVNCPEPEIYAMLKDCNMDPNEAVNRLLSQDPFHEVKSKRDKKKENKDTVDIRSRGANNITHRGNRGGGDRYGRGGSAQFNSNESSALHGKPAYKKENGTQAYVGSSSAASGMAGNHINRRPPLNSDPVATENKMLTAVDGVSSSSNPPSGYQSAWLGVPGQKSMAEIVKTGRPQNKAPIVPPFSASHLDFHSLENVSDINLDLEVSSNQHVNLNDEWPSIERLPAASVSSVLEPSADSELHAHPSNLPLDRNSQHMNSHLDEVQSAESGYVEPLEENHTQEDDSGGSSLFENNLYGNTSSYQPHGHAFEETAFEENEAEDDTASVAANLQQLSLHDEGQKSPPEEDNPSVIIPNHLQVHAQDCSHLSFGSFGSGIGSAFPGPFASRSLMNNIEETSELVDASPAGHSDTRNPEYYADEHLRNTAEDDLVHRAGVTVESYEAPSVPQSEVLKEETSEATQGNQYPFHSSSSGYSYENNQQLNAAFNNQQTSTQMQNMSPFSSVMQGYTASLPSNLLASTIQTGREPDVSYSPFPVTQSMSTKYGNAASSISGPSISMQEALRTGVSTPQPTAQAVPGAGIATGPALPQHLAMHPYSQHTLPYANMIGYSFLPQSYPYMPSAFQQSFAGNSTYQSLAAVLPQYKNNVSVSSLPQSAAVASGYGYGSSISSPAGNFPPNQPTAAGGTTIGYDDVLASQYKDAAHVISLQQNDNSPMWVHGPGSRTMSAVPGSTYYSLQGQNQQAGGYRQSQQPSQHFGALGYPNYYHSQVGISLENQQQSLRDGSLGGSQGQPPKQTPQLWQNSY